MGRGVAVVLGCALAVMGGTAGAFVGHDLSDAQLEVEMAHNRALAAYVDRNGMPDVAETHFLADRPPWDDHEVTLYYFDRHLEIAFARAYVLGRPEVQITLYERPLSDQKVAELASRARVRSTPHSGASGVMGARGGLGAAERAEAAAQRAEEAAGRVEAAVAGVERAASRAESVVAKMQTAAAGSRR